MTHGEAIRKIMEREGLTLMQLSNRMGKKNNVVWDRIEHSNISLKKLDEIVRTMNYKVVLVPDNFRVSDGQYEIE